MNVYLLNGLLGLCRYMRTCRLFCCGIGIPDFWSYV